MAQKKDNEVKGWLRIGAALGMNLISNKYTIAGMFYKLFDPVKKGFRFEEIKNSFSLFGRMMKLYFKGQYKKVSPWLFINTVVGATYLIADIDLIPDKVKNFGILDDIAVLMWVINTYAEEIEKFDIWEARRSVQDIQLA